VAAYSIYSQILSITGGRCEIMFENRELRRLFGPKRDPPSRHGRVEKAA
jgi:hypothetical protein